jgi:hypothetical protein
MSWVGSETPRVMIERSEGGAVEYETVPYC